MSKITQVRSVNTLVGRRSYVYGCRCGGGPRLREKILGLESGGVLTRPRARQPQLRLLSVALAVALVASAVPALLAPGSVRIVEAATSISVSFPPAVGAQTFNAQFSTQDVWSNIFPTMPLGTGGTSIYQRLGALNAPYFRVHAGSDGTSGPISGPNNAGGGQAPAVPFPTAFTGSDNSGGVMAIPAWDFSQLNILIPSTNDSGGGSTVTYSANTITDSGKNWQPGLWVNRVVTVGAQSRIVASNTATTLTLRTSWTPTPAAAAAYSIPSAVGATPTLMDIRYLPDVMYGGSCGTPNNRLCPIGGGTNAPGGIADQTYVAYANYMAALVGYYNKGITPGGAYPATPPPGAGPIKYWEIYNEPDLASENPRIPPTITPPSAAGVTITGVNVAGGTLTPGQTYTYKLTAITTPGVETTASGAISILLPAGNNAVQLSFPRTLSATLAKIPPGYRVYGRSGTVSYLGFVGRDTAPATLTWTDKGAFAPDGATFPPATNGTGYEAPFDPLEYKKMWDVVVPAMKAVDPTIKVVGPIATNTFSINPNSISPAVTTTDPNNSNWQDNRDYYQVLMTSANKPDVISYHQYGGFAGTETEQQMFDNIDKPGAGSVSMYQGLQQNILPYIGNTPLFQTEAGVNASQLSATNKATAATKGFGAAWFGRMIARLGSLAPNLQSIFQFQFLESPTLGAVAQDTSVGATPGDPYLNYWLMATFNARIPQGSKLLSASTTTTGMDVLAVAIPPTFTTVEVMVVNRQPAATCCNGLAQSTTLTLPSVTSSATKMWMVDSATSLVNGPAATSLGTQTSPVVNFASGYGIAFVEFVTPTVGGVAPSITSGASTTFTTGAAGTFAVSATGAPSAAISATGTLPTGVTLTDNGNGTATLSGTPAAGSGGTYPITITAANGTLPNAIQSFTLTVNQAPAITSPNSATFQVGSAGTFTVTSSGFPSGSTLSETGALPSGVTFTPNPAAGTAVLAGTPAGGSAGTYPLTITANNGVTPNATQTFTLTVGSAATAPAITSAATATFAVGSAGTFSVTTTGNPNAAITKSAGTLPSGVTLTDNGNGTATLAGTPAAATGGTYQITITAANGTLPNATQTFILTVNQAPAVTSSNSTNFVVGSAGTFTVTTSGFPVGSTISATGSLPAGVSFTPNASAGTALLAGTPGGGTAGTYPLTITANNGVAPNGTQSFTLTVSAATVAPRITSAAATTFTVGTPGTFTVIATGGPPPAITTSSGSLPSGVTLTDNGNGTARLSGTPAAGTGGSYPITIAAANGTLPNAGQSFILTVNQAPAITSVASIAFTVGAAGTFNVTTTGFPAVGTVTATGALPAGVTLTNGVLAGTPAAGSGGTYPLTITASNGVVPNASQSFTLTVNEAPSIASATSATFTVGRLRTFLVTTSGFPTPVSPITETGPLPTGVTFTDNGNGTATLTGIAAGGTGGTYPITITAANGTLPNATQSFTVTVNQPPSITSASSTTFTSGLAGTFTVTTSGTPAVTSLTRSGALPSGVNLVDNGNGSATLSGTPAPSAGGVYPITITANNGVVPNGTQVLTLTVNQPPAITSPNAATFYVGSGGSFLVTTSAYPLATIGETGALPAGVSFTNNGNGTATLAGTPASGSAGSYPLGLTASNGIGVNALQTLTLNVSASPPPTAGGAPPPPPASTQVTPSRVFDSRAAGGAIAVGTSVDVALTGQGGLPPTGAAAVLVNVTVTNPTGSGYLTVLPSTAGASVGAMDDVLAAGMGQASPLATSNLNFTAGQTVANLVVTQLGANGKVTILTMGSGTADVVVDVLGWMAGPTNGSGPAGRYFPMTPSRLYDSRLRVPIPGGGTVAIPVAGQPGVPVAGVGGVVVNLTATNAVAPGFLTLFAGGTAPGTSNLNFAAGQTVANRAIGSLDATGTMYLRNGSSGPVDVVVDVNGWISDGTGSNLTNGVYNPTTPTRLADTRTLGSPVAPGGRLKLQIAGPGGNVPAGAAAAVVNVTVTNPTASGFLKVVPSGVLLPNESDLNFTPGAVVPNLTFATLGSDGAIVIYNGSYGSADVVVDLLGWYS